MVKLIERKETVTKFILELSNEELEMIADSVGRRHTEVFHEETGKFPSEKVPDYYLLYNRLREILIAKDG
jgi:hypothetical protein